VQYVVPEHAVASPEPVTPAELHTRSLDAAAFEYTNVNLTSWPAGTGAGVIVNEVIVIDGAARTAPAAANIAMQAAMASAAECLILYYCEHWFIRLIVSHEVNKP
jgi:hypothetical protein